MIKVYVHWVASGQQQRSNTTAEYTDVYLVLETISSPFHSSGESWVASGGGSDEVHGGSGNDIIYGDGVNNWQSMDNAVDDHLMGHVEMTSFMVA